MKVKRVAILFAILIGLMNIDGRGQEPVSGRNPPKAIPARALAIETKFGLHFYQVYENETFSTHIKYPCWVFTDELPKNYLKTIAFCVPAYATDETVEKCLNAALYCAGWHQGWMELQIQAGKTVNDPVPPPHTDHT